MTSSSSPAAGFSQLYIHLLATHTYYKQTVFCIYYKSVCWSRRVELLLGNFYYLYARTVRLLCTRTRIHPRHPHCWQAAHASTRLGVRIVLYRSTTFYLFFFFPVYNNLLAAKNTRTTTQESVTVSDRGEGIRGSPHSLI